jgi:CubicO group peptidase (beta-lactamase class C family)
MKMKKNLTILILFELLLVLGLCAIPTIAQPNSTITRDYWPTQEWKTSTPEEQGMNSTILNMTADYLETCDTQYHGFLVVKNGYIVYEDYTGMYHKDAKHNTMACTKSITSTLIGIALDQGHIEGLDNSVLDYFPDCNITNWDPRMEQITISHLLTMTSGMEWSEYTSDDDLIHMWFSENWVDYALNQPLIADPGEQFGYCSGGSHLLSAIINRSTGLSPYNYAFENLFEPLGIEDAYWPEDEHGIHNGGTDIAITPRDMARFGYLFLNNGTWDNEEIVSYDWVREATSSKVTVSSETTYGLHWWISPNMNTYSARGIGAQSIVVMPEHDLVVVSTGNQYSTLPNCTSNDCYSLPSLDYVVSNYIIPSIEDYTPLEEEILFPVIVVGIGLSFVALVVIVYLKRRT